MYNYSMRYIFIYYNIIYIILLILIFFYIKKILNNCYNIEEFEGTYQPEGTNSQDETNSPDEDDDGLGEIIQRLKGRGIINKIQQTTTRYNVDPINTTSVNNSELYSRENESNQAIIDKLTDDIEKI